MASRPAPSVRHQGRTRCFSTCRRSSSLPVQRQTCGRKTSSAGAAFSELSDRWNSIPRATGARLSVRVAKIRKRSRSNTARLCWLHLAAPRSGPQASYSCFIQVARAAVFFLRRPTSRQSAPRPDANIGNAAGNGVSADTGGLGSMPGLKVKVKSFAFAKLGSMKISGSMNANAEVENWGGVEKHRIQSAGGIGRRYKSLHEIWREPGGGPWPATRTSSGPDDVASA
jgi:hypothetical protein